MPIVILNTNDPYLNLAVEEVLLDLYELNEDLCIIWFSKPAFIVGRNQNAFIEVNPIYKDIPVIRRISGGGTIYQDLNTINFSIITKDYHNNINNYEHFLSPIIEALKSVHVEVSFKPKSHLIVNNKKISGNAQAFRNNRLLHHGTLLYDSNLEIIQKALVDYNPESHGNQVPSNKQIVTNLINYLPNNISKNDLVEIMLEHICSKFNISNNKISLDKRYLDIASILARDKYASWEWNYGKCSVFKIHLDSCILTVDKGVITQVSLEQYNDLLGLRFRSDDYHRTIKKLRN